MLRKLSIGLALSSTALLMPQQASANGVAMIKQLIDAEKFHEAYLLANSYLEEKEGDADFDLQYGVAAVDSGNVSEGVFALERVVFLQPDNLVARLELARGYYQLEQYERAKRLFEQVLKHQPPANVRQRIVQYLALIESETAFPITRFTSFVELWAGYDSNINSGPDSQTDVVTLTSDALGRGDGFNQLVAGAGIEHRYADNARLDFSIAADLRNYHSESEQDYRSIQVSGSHTWLMPDQQFQLGFSIQAYSRDSGRYRDMLSIDASWTRQLSEQSVFKLFGGISLLEYTDQSWRDSTLTSVGGSYLLLGEGSWSPLYFAGLFVGQEKPQTPGVLANADVDRLLYGSNVGVQLSPLNDLTVTPMLTYQASDYAGEHWIYGVKREDDYTTVNLNLEYQLDEALTVLGKFSYSQADSNIELYEYDRDQALLGLRYQFK